MTPNEYWYVSRKIDKKETEAQPLVMYLPVILIIGSSSLLLPKTF
jgi:hypothetical protein